MPYPQFLDHAGITGYAIALDPAQQAQFEANGWVATDPPIGVGEDYFRALWTIDIGDIVAPLVGGLVPLENLPGSADGGLDEDGVAEMWDTEDAVNYDSGTHKLTLTIDASGLDAEAVEALVAGIVTEGQGITVDWNDGADTITFAIDLEYLQDKVAEMLDGTHDNVTVTYNPTTGKLTLAASGSGTIGDRTISGDKIVLGAIGRDEVDSDEIPAYNEDGSLDVADSETGVEPDPGTAASHGAVEDLIATLAGMIFDLWGDNSILVANDEGDPVALTMPTTGTHVPGTVAGVWTAIDVDDLPSGGTGGGTPVEPTLFSYTDNGRKWAAARAGAVTGGPPAKIVMVGDSTTELIYGNPVEKLRRRFTRFNTTNRLSPGWINADTQTISLHEYQFGLTTGSAGSVEGNDNKRDSNYGLAAYAYRLASGSVITLQDFSNATAKPIFDTAEFHYTKKKAAGTADLEIRIDGNLVQTISTQDGAITPAFESGNTYTWTGALGPHTITVTGAGGNSALFDGMYLSAGDQVWIYNAGHTGFKYSDYLTAANVGPNQALAKMNPACVINANGINDYGDGHATLSTNIGTWIAETRAAVPDVSLGIVIPYATGTHADWYTDFVPAMKTAAGAADVPVCDMSWMLEVAPGTADPQNLVTVDNVHIEAAGGELYASQLSKFILGDDFDPAILGPKGLAVWSKTTAQTPSSTSGSPQTLGPSTTDFAGEVITALGIWIPLVAGWWRVSANAEIAANATGDRELFLDKNSGTIIPIARCRATSAGATVLAGSTLVHFNGVTDTVLVRIQQDGGTLAVIPRQVAFELVRPD